MRPDVVQSVAFSRSAALGATYPNSPMGAIALIRQTLLDADWYRRAWEAYESSGRAFLPPETSEAWASLDRPARGAQAVLFEATREEEHLRLRAIADEFGVVAWARGSGDEYRILDVLQDSDVPLIVPIDFPDAPDIESPEDALDVSRAELRHWYLAPENPGRLAAAGVEFAITTDGLGSDDDFFPNLRAAVSRGLGEADALAALTTVPARLLGIDRTHGTIEAGKVANVVVVEGDLFRGDIPVTVAADEAIAIQDAVRWAEDESIRIVIRGGRDAIHVADLLAERGIAVMLTSTMDAPSRSYEPYDAAYARAAQLHQRGVRIAISGGSSAAYTNRLPYEAGVAVAFGLPEEVAIEAVTLAPAEMMGIADRVGSLEPGKDATLLITTGSPLDYLSSIEQAYIEGREIDMRDIHRFFFEKYMERLRQPPPII